MVGGPNDAVSPPLKYSIDIQAMIHSKRALPVA